MTGDEQSLPIDKMMEVGESSVTGRERERTIGKWQAFNGGQRAMGNAEGRKSSVNERERK